MIAGIEHQVFHSQSGIQDVKATKSLALNGVKTPDGLSLPKALGFLASKGSNHDYS
jgi:hypothetical protein